MDNPPLKILLIEGQPEFARHLGEMLAQAKGAVFDLAAFYNFEDGLARLIGGNFDLALIDLSLPDGAGLANIVAQAAFLGCVLYACYKTAPNTGLVSSV